MRFHLAQPDVFNWEVFVLDGNAATLTEAVITDNRYVRGDVKGSAATQLPCERRLC